MGTSYRNPPWIAIAFLAVLFCITVIAATPAQALPAPDAGAVTGFPAGSLSLQDVMQRESCTRESMDACEKECMMPGGVLDLNCYEECIYSIC